jgi:hypothetical protein
MLAKQIIGDLFFEGPRLFDPKRALLCAQRQGGKNRILQKEIKANLFF